MPVSVFNDEEQAGYFGLKSGDNVVIPLLPGDSGLGIDYSYDPDSAFFFCARTGSRCDEDSLLDLCPFDDRGPYTFPEGSVSYVPFELRIVSCSTDDRSLQFKLAYDTWESGVFEVPLRYQASGTSRQFEIFCLDRITI